MNDDMEQKNVDDVENADFTNETIIDDEYKEIEIEKEEKKSSNRWVSIVISLILLLYSVYEYNVAYEKEYDRQMEIYNAERELLDHISSAFSDSNYEYEEEEEEPFSLTGPQVYVLEESNQIYDSLKLDMDRAGIIALMGEPASKDGWDRASFIDWNLENDIIYNVTIDNGVVSDYYFESNLDESSILGMTEEEIINLIGEPILKKTYGEKMVLDWNIKYNIHYNATLENGIVIDFLCDFESATYEGVKYGMTQKEIVTLLGEPDYEFIVPATTILRWKTENGVEYKVRIEEGNVQEISRDLESSSYDNIQLSTEIGTEIEDLKIIANDLKDGMEISEVTKILGDKYIELCKQEDYLVNVWYDKLENFIEISFEKSGDYWVTKYLDGLDDIESPF